MSRYAIWNKKDTIITPSGAVFTAEQWIVVGLSANAAQIKTR